MYSNYGISSKAERIFKPLGMDRSIMQNTINIIMVEDVVTRLEKQHWDVIDRNWIPVGSGVESIIYSSRVIGEYELLLVISGVESFGCLTVRLALSKHLSFNTTASIYLIHKEDLEQAPDALFSEIERANSVLEIFERKCPKEGFTIGLEELANLLQEEM